MSLMDHTWTRPICRRSGTRARRRHAGKPERGSEPSALKLLSAASTRLCLAFCQSVAAAVSSEDVSALPGEKFQEDFFF